MSSIREPETPVMTTRVRRRFLPGIGVQHDSVSKVLFSSPADAPRSGQFGRFLQVPTRLSQAFD